MPATVAGIHLGPDTHANRPAANAAGLPVGSLYSCTDHSLIYQTDGSAWSTWATLGSGGGVTVQDEGTPLATTGTTLNFVGAGVTASGTGAEKTITIPGASSTPDPITTQFGAPTTAFDFDTSSFTGLTSIGTSTTEDADTTVPDHYYIKKSSASELAGRYLSAPSEPYTAILKITGGWSARTDGRGFGGALFNGSTSLTGGVDVLRVRYLGSASGWHGFLKYWSGSPPTPNSDVNVGGAFDPQYPVWLAVVGSSSTSYSYYYSLDGYVWVAVTSARNPGYTIDVVGFGVALEGTAGWAICDYFYVYNSALSLIAAP